MAAIIWGLFSIRLFEDTTTTGTKACSQTGSPLKTHTHTHLWMQSNVRCPPVSGIIHTYNNNSSKVRGYKPSARRPSSWPSCPPRWGGCVASGGFWGTAASCCLSSYCLGSSAAKQNGSSIYAWFTWLNFVFASSFRSIEQQRNVTKHVSSSMSPEVSPVWLQVCRACATCHSVLRVSVVWTVPSLAETNTFCHLLINTKAGDCHK